MRSRRSIGIKTIIYVVFLIYVISIFIFSYKIELNKISNGIFILFAMLTLIIVFRPNKIKFPKSYIMLGVFVAYSFLSILWSLNSDTALAMSITLLLMFVLSFLVYLTFANENGAEYILKSLMIAGLVMSIYTIFYYGLSTFIESLLSGIRLGTEINQVNILGMYAANTTILCVYYAMLKNKKYFYIIAILPFLVSLSSGSRTALAMCFLGVILLMLLHHGTRKIYKGVLAALVVGVVFYYLLNLPFFDKTIERTVELLNIFSDTELIDHSAQIRFFMIDFGMDQFRKNPIWGYGADSARYLLNQVLYNTYLHNNYVELLVNYGLIGFLLYYSIFVNILLKIIPMLKGKNPEAIAITVLLVIKLIADYGTVSYYDKTTYLMLAVGLIVINYRKKIEL